ncbi:hypothetical protein DXG03_004344 [Asterophora parasitica]|uniref:chitinase n=1 Tax=Asterophora parasitica TaxID=117018 RepID=A0A9P7GEZ7_9AGAR|nr:hypothetical protein DXG03_004344 [Asterophora parasitica]
MANTCNSNGGNVFPGTRLAKCTSLASDIKACQARGKIITLSLGGATGLASFTSDAQARTFAETVWNLFLGGKSSTRPFGDAILDGVDLDIEGGSGKGLTAFVTRIRELAQGASKQYYLTAAPQCPFPDVYLGSVISAVGFDAVYVQAWNFGVWDNWAKKTSPNKNVKVYIGAPASASAAGSGYVSGATLGKIAVETRAKYSSFGGIMLWDASQAYGNNRYDKAIKSAIAVGGGGSPPTPTPTPPVDDDESNVFYDSSIYANAYPAFDWELRCASPQYVGGTRASYNGRLWTAKWWTQGDTPGGGVGVWADDGACAPSTQPTSSTPEPTSGPGGGGDACTGIASWSSGLTYVGGNKAVYGGRLWTARWWSYADTPGGSAGVWADNDTELLRQPVVFIHK